MSGPPSLQSSRRLEGNELTLHASALSYSLRHHVVYEEGISANIAHVLCLHNFTNAMLPPLVPKSGFDCAPCGRKRRDAAGAAGNDAAGTDADGNDDATATSNSDVRRTGAMTEPTSEDANNDECETIAFATQSKC
jgi:hypothetical protein